MSKHSIFFGSSILNFIENELECDLLILIELCPISHASTIVWMFSMFAISRALIRSNSRSGSSFMLRSGLNRWLSSKLKIVLGQLLWFRIIRPFSVSSHSFSWTQLWAWTWSANLSLCLIWKIWQNEKTIRNAEKGKKDGTYISFFERIRQLIDSQLFQR